MDQSSEEDTQEQKDSKFRTVSFQVEKKAIDIIDKSLHGINRSDLLRNFCREIANQLVKYGPFSIWEIKFYTNKDVHEIMKRTLIPEI